MYSRVHRNWRVIKTNWLFSQPANRVTSSQHRKFTKGIRVYSTAITCQNNWHSLLFHIPTMYAECMKVNCEHPLCWAIWIGISIVMSNQYMMPVYGRIHAEYSYQVKQIDVSFYSSLFWRHNMWWAISDRCPSYFRCISGENEMPELEVKTGQEHFRIQSISGASVEQMDPL